MSDDLIARLRDGFCAMHSVLNPTGRTTNTASQTPDPAVNALGAEWMRREAVVAVRFSALIEHEICDAILAIPGPTHTDLLAEAGRILADWIDNMEGDDPHLDAALAIIDDIPDAEAVARFCLSLRALAALKGASHE